MNPTQRVEHAAAWIAICQNAIVCKQHTCALEAISKANTLLEQAEKIIQYNIAEEKQK